MRVVRHVRVPGVHDSGCHSLPRLCRKGTHSVSSGVLVTSAVAPLLGNASLAAEQVSQLVLGEGAVVLEQRDQYVRVRTLLDDYEGWLHRGYTRTADLNEVEGWLATAAWSEGALIEGSAGVACRAPHRARVQLEGPDRVRLPDGSAGAILSGRIRPFADILLHARGIPAADWAWREFAGAPYQWGGITASGIDCSGLVQTTFLMRGVSLPRDARLQSGHGEEVAQSAMRVDDLLFFRGQDTSTITHVAIVAGHDTIVHSTVETGRVTREPWGAGTRAAALRDRVGSVRRLI